MSKNTSQVNLFNPTYFDSKPIIRVGGSGSGTITIVDEDANRQVITIKNMATTTDDIVIDSDIEQTYLESSYTFFNSNVTFTDLKYPWLSPGKNTITKTGSNIYINIIPRWYML